MSSDVELYRDNEEIYLTEQDKQLFTQVDDILAEAKERWDPSVLFGFGRELRKNVRVSGVALAKLLWGITDVWDYLIENNAVDDNVWDAIHSEMGVPPGTARSAAVRIADHAGLLRVSHASGTGANADAPLPSELHPLQGQVSAAGRG